MLRKFFAFRVGSFSEESQNKFWSGVSSENVYVSHKLIKSFSKLIRCHVNITGLDAFKGIVTLEKNQVYHSRFSLPSEKWYSPKRIKIYPVHDITYKMACAPCENSDKTGHPPSMIRVFAVRMKKAWVLSYPLSAQRRLWSDWRMPRLILVFTGRTCHFVGFVMRLLKCAPVGSQSLPFWKDPFSSSGLVYRKANRKLQKLRPS